MSYAHTPETRLLTVHEVAVRWACSSRTVQRAIEDGRLRARRFGPKLIRVHPDDLEAFEATTCDTNSSAPSSMADSPPSGTSAGPKADARVAYLQRKPTR